MRLDSVNFKITSEIKKFDNARKQGKSGKSYVLPKSDKSDFSPEAQRLNNTRASMEIVSSRIAAESDIRPEKIEEVRKKLQAGYYNSPEFIDKLTDKMCSVFGVSKS